MKGILGWSKGQTGEPLSINHIAIIYCISSELVRGRETEKLADCEVLEVAHCVQESLTHSGFDAVLVSLNPDKIDQLQEFDWVFNLTESICGFPLFDYEIAHQLEILHIGFTGSGSRTLQNCLDKAVTKCELVKNGIPTPVFEVFPPNHPIINHLRFPLLVKPIHEDGSIGISNRSIVRNLLELENQVNFIHNIYQQSALVEDYITGRDITASIIGNGDEAVLLPLSEITYPIDDHPGILTFDAKWQEHTLEYQGAVAVCPAQLEPKVATMIGEIALWVYQVMECRDYARVDFRLQGRAPYVLEVNPNPCINPDDSGFVRSSIAAGMTYVEMVNLILTSSIQIASRIGKHPAMVRT